jgi:hypothetical protein
MLNKDFKNIYQTFIFNYLFVLILVFVLYFVILYCIVVLSLFCGFKVVPQFAYINVFCTVPLFLSVFCCCVLFFVFIIFILLFRTFHEL